MFRSDIVLVIIGSALVTLLPRTIPLMLLSRANLPASVIRWLGYVPIAVLGALLAQSVGLSDGHFVLPPENRAPIAIIPAIIVAIWTRSLFGTVAAGILSMALLRWLFG